MATIESSEELAMEYHDGLQGGLECNACKHVFPKPGTEGVPAIEEYCPFTLKGSHFRWFLMTCPDCGRMLLVVECYETNIACASVVIEGLIKDDNAELNELILTMISHHLAYNGVCDDICEADAPVTPMLITVPPWEEATTTQDESDTVVVCETTRMDVWVREGRNATLN